MLALSAASETAHAGDLEGSVDWGIGGGYLRFMFPPKLPPPRPPVPDDLLAPPSPSAPILVIPNRALVPEPVTVRGTYEYLLAEADDERSTVFKHPHVRRAVRNELKAYGARPGATYEVRVRIDPGAQGYALMVGVRELPPSVRISGSLQEIRRQLSDPGISPRTREMAESLLKKAEAENPTLLDGKDIAIEITVEDGRMRGEIRGAAR